MPFLFMVFGMMISVVMPAFVVAKILSDDRKLRGKEIIYFILASLLTATVILFNLAILDAAFYGLLGDVVVMCFLFLYFYKMAAKPAQLSLILTFFSFLIALLIEQVTFAGVYMLIPVLQLGLLLAVLHVLIIYAASILFSLLLMKVFGKLLASITQAGRLRTTLLLIATFLVIFSQGMRIIWIYFEDRVTALSWNTFFVLTYTFAIFVCFIFYAKSLRAELTLQQKKVEQQRLQHYMDELEQQQMAIQKFKHDYQNILYSLEIFISEKDLDGLAQYYATKVKAASEVLSQNNFALESLRNIKVQEIKGILTVKLILAQNLGIDTRFEAGEEIDHIPVDSLALVRMLGIILDNAIEELTEMENGKLQVLCFQSGGGVTFVVQNTCRPDTPSFSQLRQEGFSTKGKGRGFGLNNLWEIASSYPNVTLQTHVSEGNFVQRVMIGEL